MFGTAPLSRARGCCTRGPCSCPSRMHQNKPREVWGGLWGPYLAVCFQGISQGFLVLVCQVPPAGLRGRQGLWGHLHQHTALQLWGAGAKSHLLTE